MPQTPQHIIDKINNARKEKSKSLNLAKEDLTEIPSGGFGAEFSLKKLKSLTIKYLFATLNHFIVINGQ